MLIQKKKWDDVNRPTLMLTRIPLIGTWVNMIISASSILSARAKTRPSRALFGSQADSHLPSPFYSTFLPENSRRCFILRPLISSLHHGKIPQLWAESALFQTGLPLKGGSIAGLGWWPTLAFPLSYPHKGEGPGLLIQTDSRKVSLPRHLVVAAEVVLLPHLFVI